ncbi:MAG: bifunctional methylenetetrahydrofolate dehydrogenase/methenyltetrahydrofolate cyclohydrolase FolD [Candidatus Krumholzibacteriia bacterium]
MIILDGRPVRDAVLSELALKVAGAARAPGLAVILVGDDPASAVYVGQKEKGCAAVGFHHRTHRLPADASEREVLALVDRLNADPLIDGILVQMPLPRHIDGDRVLLAVDPAKDVDGFHPENLGRLVSGRPRSVACTPRGVLRLLSHYGIPVAGRRVAVVGRSVIVGRPMALLLNLKAAMGDATVIMCHSRTPDLAAETRRADVVIAALGRPEFITRDHVAAGAVVVDVGINRVDAPGTRKGHRLVGDVAAAEMEGHAAALTPVPGGVGPMTIAMLLENTWEAMVRREEGDGG